MSDSDSQLHNCKSVRWLGTWQTSRTEIVNAMRESAIARLCHPIDLSRRSQDGNNARLL